MIVPIREDRRYRSWRTTPLPQSNAVIIYIMDVSGSMGDEQKEIVRIELVLDRHLAALAVQGARVPLHHPRRRGQGGRPRHLLPHPRVGRHDDLQRVQAVRQDDRGRVPAREWNIYPFHFSDGDNWSVDDTVLCIELLKNEILPKVNLFCYGQVESPYGSGQFIKDLNEHFDEDDSVVVLGDQEQGRDHGVDPDFLGKGK